MASLQEDAASTAQRMRAVKEELAERDAQLRVATLNLDTAQKQNSLHTQEVRRKYNSLSIPYHIRKIENTSAQSKVQTFDQQNCAVVSFRKQACA